MITNFVPVARLSRPMPLAMETITSAPSSTETTRPRPPNRLVPPITAAAITLSSRSPPPVLVATERRREARMIPPRPAMNPEIMNT